MAEVPMDPIEANDDTPEDDYNLKEKPDARDADDDGDGAGSKQAVLADLARERKARQRIERELRQIQEQNQTDAEKAIAAARAEGRSEALSVANKRILTAEVKAVAAGVLQDPDDAIRLIDLDQFEVDDDGNVNTKAVMAEVQRLAKAKPYLAVGAKPAPLPAGGATPSTGPSMDDALRAAVRSKRL